MLLSYVWKRDIIVGNGDNMKVLITGGTGTISSGIAQAAVNAGMEVYTYTRGRHSERDVPGAQVFVGDVWNSEDVKNKLDSKRFDVVVECLAYDIEHLKMSLKNLGKRCGQYIFISTAGIYTRNGNRPIKESDPKELTEWDYTKEKIECESYLREYCILEKINYTIIRPTVTYGDYRIPFPVVSRKNQWSLFQRMREGRPIVACGSKDIYFSIIHIVDFSKRVVALFGNKAAFNEDFHICSQDSVYAWDEIIACAAKILGCKADIIHVPLEVFKNTFDYLYDELKWNKSSDLILDDAKLKGVTGIIETEITLEEGIRKAIYNLEEEYRRYNKVLDRYWERCCDRTLLRAYQKKAVCSQESSVLKEYFRKMSKKDRIFLEADLLTGTTKAVVNRSVAKLGV